MPSLAEQEREVAEAREATWSVTYWMLWDMGGPEIVAHAFDLLQHEPPVSRRRRFAFAILERHLSAGDPRRPQLAAAVQAYHAAAGSARDERTTTAGMAGGFRLCYESTMSIAGAFSAVGEIQITVGSNGVVTDVVSNLPETNDGFAICIEGEVLGTTYAPATSNERRVVIPINFVRK